MDFSTLKKALTFILTLSVFFVLVSNLSCTKKTPSKDNGVVFDTIQENKTQSIDYKKSKLNCNLHISFVYPVAWNKSAPLADLQKRFIEKVFPSLNANLSPKDAVSNFSAQYLRDFQAIPSKDSFEDDDLLEDENNFMYELNLENEVLYNQNGFISFVVKNTNYEGGAHGSNSIYGYVFNITTGKFLTEEDFEKDDYKKNVASLLAWKIAEANGLTDVAQLENNGYNAVDAIVPNENFTIDDKGITYYFNEYEIAAYFIGITKVFIPYEELKPFVTSNSPVTPFIDR